MASGPVGDEVERLGLRGVQHRLDARPPRIGNRTLWQSGATIGVVAVVGVELRLEDAAAEWLPLGHGVDHRRVGIEFHSDPQSVAIDAGDGRPLSGFSGFLLDDGRQRDRLLDGADGTIRAPLRPQLIDCLGHRLLHALDDGCPALAALIPIAVGQQRAFIDRRRWTGEVRICSKLLANDDRRHPLRDR